MNMSTTIKSMAVIGAGTMGAGIALVAAQSGLQVFQIDVKPEQLERAKAYHRKTVDRAVEKQRMTRGDADAALARVRYVPSMADAKGAEWVVEAATENADLKKRIFKEMQAAFPAPAVLATNTSSISITDIAAAVGADAGRVIGMHFFNPVPVMALVELIRGLETSDETTAAVEEVSKKIGKSPIKVRNSPGFAVNRILIPMLNEAIFAFSEGIATAQEIDDGMRLGCNHPIGPLALCDMVGLDVLLGAVNVLCDSFKDSKYRPAPLLVEMVEAGHLGRKTGRGFYHYK